MMFYNKDQIGKIHNAIRKATDHVKQSLILVEFERGELILDTCYEMSKENQDIARAMILLELKGMVQRVRFIIIPEDSEE